MSQFKAAGYEVKEGSGKPGKSIKPGIHQAIIVDVKYGESSQKKTPFIEFTHETAPVEGLKDESGKVIGQRARTTMYISDKSWDIKDAMWCVKARLTLMATKLGVLEEFNKIEGDSAEEFVNKLVPLFKGKKARWVFGGEERSFKNDKDETINFVQPFLNTFGFVENLTDVPANEDTKLKFDANKHIKKAEVADSVESDSAAPTADDNPWG